MGQRRRTQELLPKKLLAIREFLALGQVEMAASLESHVPPHKGRPYNIKPGRISEYENGRREPNLVVLLAYAQLGRVHLELIADDRFTLKAFRDQLGKHTLSRK